MNIVRRFSALADSCIAFIQNNPVSIISAAGILAATTLLRALLENYSNPEPFGGFTAWYIVLGFFLYYAGVALMLVTLLNWILKKDKKLIWSAIMLSMPVIVTAPIFDLIISGGNGYCLAYLGDSGWKLVGDFFTFFGAVTFCGVSPGIRIEILIALFGIGVFAYKMTRNFWKTVASVVGSYAIIFANLTVSGIIVTFVQGFNWTGNPGIFFSDLMQKSLLVSTQIYTATGNVLAQNYAASALFTSRISWIICAIMMPVIWYQQNSLSFKAYFKDIRWARIAYYGSLGIFGMYMALSASGYNSIPHTLPDILGYIIFFAVIGFGFTFAAATNDIVDVPIDAISNAHRPLVSGALNVEEYKNIAFVLGLLILSGSLLINYDFFICALIFHVCFYLYSIPPLRLKRHFVSGGLLLALAGLATIMGGYFFFSTSVAFNVVPLPILVWIFCFLFIIVHIRDFKDIEGDAKEGIRTLPVVFGEKKARRIIGGAIALGGILTGLVLIHYFLPFAIVLWILSISFGFIMWFRKADERVAFVFMYLAVLAAIFLL